MTQTPFDAFSKQYLEEFLTPLGTVQRQYEVPGESKFVDVWFVPETGTQQALTELGILGQMVQSMCLLEPFRNAPTRQEVRTSLLKLLWIQEDEQRKAKQDKNPLQETELPTLWVLAATASEPVITDTGGEIKSEWLPGIYFMADLLKTAIVVIDELPVIPETLLLRILGRDDTQANAIREVLALPKSDPRRDNILRLASSWKIRIDLNEIPDFTGEEALMALSEAYLNWERETQERSERSLILRLLNRRVGEISASTLEQINTLSLEQLESLGEALLDFTAIADLTQWLSDLAQD
jgi:hypothetical protein